MNKSSANNLVAGVVIALMLLWSIKAMFYKDGAAEIEEKVAMVKAGQSSSNITTQRKGAIAQKELQELQSKNKGEGRAITDEGVATGDQY